MSDTVTRPPETNGGVVTSWLPLPTDGSAAPDRSTAIYSQVSGGGQGPKAIAFDPYFG